MRQALSVIVTLAILTRLAEAGPDTATIVTQISGMPVGTNIELHLKNAQKLRGARGATSETGFMLIDAHAGERQIAFNDVASVKRFSGKPHTVRNILIVAGVAIAALAIAAGVLLRCGGLGCR